MGDIRNDMKKEGGAIATIAVALGGLALKGIASVANASSIMNMSAKIDANEAKKKELSKGFGRFTNSDEIDALDKKNASLREKINGRSK